MNTEAHALDGNNKWSFCGEENQERQSGLRNTVVDPWGNSRWRSDHPSVMGLYGMVPGDGVDMETMQRTFDKVYHLWPRWKWGWDNAMVAMSAARLGKRETAVDVLLHPDFHFSVSGAGYFPGRGGLLYAVAMMAAGWDGCPEGNAPGFLDHGSWSVKWNGLKTAP